MHVSWSKGFRKETHPSVMKISLTMRRKKINNFATWMEGMKAVGKIKSVYPPLTHSENLAELLGVVLGDGHIQVFPRTERLTISANSTNEGFVQRYYAIVENVFGKKPTLVKAKSKKCTRISIYERFISKRLGIPTGNRRYATTKTPKWISESKSFLRAYLRGLYEAEGSFCVHESTSTYKFLFSNKNLSLLRIVFKSVKALGFHPNMSGYKVQVSKKEEVFGLKKLINFRIYDTL